jgi:hypothetical protein
MDSPPVHTDSTPPDTEPVSTDPPKPDIPTANELSMIPKDYWDVKTIYYKPNDHSPFFKITTPLRVREDGEIERFSFTWYDHNTKTSQNVTNASRGDIYELRSDRRAIRDAAAKEAADEYAFLEKKMEPVKRSNLDPSDDNKRYAFYKKDNDSRYIKCTIVKAPFQFSFTKSSKPITIQVGKNAETQDVDISTIFRPTRNLGGGRGKKTKKGGYKHKKSNRKQKYHSRKVRKPRNRNGRTYSIRRS